MNTEENETLLETASYGTSNAASGITYFKLKSEYSGDYTKNCGLLGEEVDSNFYFLRGYDISSAELNDEHNLVIKRVNSNYDPIVITLNSGLQPTFTYNKETGVLVVSYPNSSTTEVSGFTVEKEIDAATDSTLDGNGSSLSPLSLSPTEKTGQYSPAASYMDISSDNQMPSGSGYSKGYRLVTKETINKFGLLYPYEGVEQIEKALEADKSQWRVPTKEDWDELLNAVELCGDKNHSATTTGWLGKMAGKALKSAEDASGYDYWQDYSVSGSEVDVKGEDIVGMTILPVGHVPDRDSIMVDASASHIDAEGMGYFASMWTSTKDAVNNIYSKTFAYSHADVRQNTYSNSSMLSLRLVKDYISNNHNEYENILGITYPCTLVNVKDDDTEYIKIWTSVNIGDTNPLFSGVTSDEWSALTEEKKVVKTVFYINEWNGTEWVKKMMQEGDSVVILNHTESGATTSYHEWRVVDGELVDTIASLEARVAELESKLSPDNFRALVKAAALDIFKGTDKEISITDSDDNIVIGFDNDAVFGEI